MRLAAEGHDLVLGHARDAHPQPVHGAGPRRRPRQRGRSGQPEEVAGAIAWLLSEDASYTTGAVLRVCGGR
ncbi:hypothetical protein GCM10017750_61110 [Streptomyces racemochromogenes]